MKLRRKVEKKQKIVVSIWSEKERFPNGKKSKHYTVYEARPEEVDRVIAKALEEAAD